MVSTVTASELLLAIRNGLTVVFGGLMVTRFVKVEVLLAVKGGLKVTEFDPVLATDRL